MSAKNWFCGEYPEALEYLGACKNAVLDDNVFEKFKSLKEYQHILEHTSVSQGAIYREEILRIISTNKLNKKEIIEKSKINDKLGTPDLSYFEDFDLISPSTLRYLLFVLRIKTAINLSRVDTFLDIGGGYGGMSLLVNSILECDKIILNDLKEALELQQKYLNQHGIKAIVAENIEEIANQEIDLCVSTFAFSELTKQQRKNIIEKIFPNCKIIYLVCNFINTEEFEDSEIFEFAEKNFNIYYSKESHMGHLCSSFLLIKKS